MLPKEEIIKLYNGYKAKYEQLESKSDDDIGLHFRLHNICYYKPMPLTSTLFPYLSLI